MISFSRTVARGSLKASRASSPRLSEPFSCRIRGPNSVTSSARAGPPGSTRSRAIWSASMTTAPRSTSMPATVLLPEPIPPVRPMRVMPRPYDASHKDDEW